MRLGVANGDMRVTPGMIAGSAEIPTSRIAARPSHAVRLLQVFSVALMAFPADYVVKAVGADGYAAAPAVVALAARRRTADPELRDLCAALAGAALAAVLCAATFDGFSFPMFFNLQALIAGLVGAVWMMATKEGDMRAYQSGES